MSDQKTFPKSLLTYNEAASKLKISPGTLRGWVCKGKIQCFKIGGAVRFTEEQLCDALHVKN